MLSAPLSSASPWSWQVKRGPPAKRWKSTARESDRSTAPSRLASPRMKGWPELALHRTSSGRREGLILGDHDLVDDLAGLPDPDGQEVDPRRGNVHELRALGTGGARPEEPGVHGEPVGEAIIAGEPVQ